MTTCFFPFFWHVMTLRTSPPLHPPFQEESWMQAWHDRPLMNQSEETSPKNSFNFSFFLLNPTVKYVYSQFRNLCSWIQNPCILSFLTGESCMILSHIFCYRVFYSFSQFISSFFVCGGHPFTHCFIIWHGWILSEQDNFILNILVM